ncbi:MAG TPA: hypothetical protein VGW38_02720 [Chloroflexota bacterium]|nr:hypothetical protein [Chloroflexota bacterium]
MLLPPGVIMPFTPHADVADRYLQHRTAIMRRLERVNQALAYVDEYEANKHLPMDLQRPMRAPTFGRRDLAELRRMLAEELGRLQQGGLEEG